MDVEELNRSERYKLIVEDEYLKNRLLFLSVGGAHSYGLQREESDVDLRGVFSQTAKEFITTTPKKVFPSDGETSLFGVDTVFQHLISQDPCFIQYLFIPEELVLFKSDSGKLLLDNRELFLSKQTVKSFLGFSSQFIHKINKESKESGKLADLIADLQIQISQQKKSILESYGVTDDSTLNFYIDNSSDTVTGYDVFMDANFKRLPVDAYYQTIFDIRRLASFFRISKGDNGGGIKNRRMAKSMCYAALSLIWLKDILDNGTFCTRPNRYHNILMDIKLGKYTTEEFQVSKEFDEIYEQLRHEALLSAERSELRETLEKEKIQQLKYDIVMSIQ